MRREVITLLQIHHENIVPFLGVVTDEHHPLALISPYYEQGHALRYLTQLNSLQRPVASLRIVSSNIFGLNDTDGLRHPLTERGYRICSSLPPFAKSSNCTW